MRNDSTSRAHTSDLLDVLGPDPLVVDLGRVFTVGMPQSPNHPAYWHALPRRHGDMVRPDGGSAANDIISMGTHVGTHVDALCHVSHDGLLHGGTDADDALRGGRYTELGAHTIPPMLCRGVLLDVPRALGVPDGCEAGYEITPDDLECTVAQQETALRRGDVVLVRSGWGRKFTEGAPYVGTESGVPGVGEAGARWLAARAPRAVGADTIAFERLAPRAGHSVLPAHRVLLVEAGIYIIEAMDLDELAELGHHEFLFVLSPLALYGATGSPARPLAVIGRD